VVSAVTGLAAINGSGTTWPVPQFAAAFVLPGPEVSRSKEWSVQRCPICNVPADFSWGRARQFGDVAGASLHTVAPLRWNEDTTRSDCAGCPGRDRVAEGQGCWLRASGVGSRWPPSLSVSCRACRHLVSTVTRR